MKKSIELLLLSFAMGLGVSEGVSSFNNGEKSLAKTNTIINKKESIDNVDRTLPTAVIGSIRTVDATYTGMENFGPETSFNQHDYFANLKNYSPNNNIGSCGYVSLSQLLCYYDTFYNDSIVPEKYEVKNMDAKTEAEANAQSPGVIKQYYSASTYGTYYNYCHTHMEDDIQCKLTVIHNQLEGTDNPEKFAYSIGGWDYQEMLNVFYGSENFVKVETHQTYTQAQYISYIKSHIDAGHPVVVHVKHSNGASGAHSVIAYDYDDTKIYTHYGWGDYSSTYDLLQSYDQIYFVGTLDFSSIGHSCSNNYVINGKGYCGCNITNEIHAKTTFDNKKIIYWANDGKSTGGSVAFGLRILRIIKDDFLLRDDLFLHDHISADELMYKGNSAETIIPGREEFLFDDSLVIHDFNELMDDSTIQYTEISGEEEIDEYLVNNNLELDVSYAGTVSFKIKPVVYIVNSTSNAIVLSDALYNSIFGTKLSVRTTFTRKSSIKYAATSRLVYASEFNYRDLTLKASDYAFGNTYATARTTKAIVKDDVTVTTNRLRCGSIYDSSITHKTYTTLSAKKTGYGEAYLEYDFGTAIKDLTIDLAMWSSSESLDAKKGTATIDYLDEDGEWVVIQDLLNGTLSMDKDNMTTYEVTFPAGVTTFRVHSTVKSATSSSNKARLCIGELTVTY